MRLWIRELSGNLSVRMHDLCIKVKQNTRDFLLIGKLFFSVNYFKCVTGYTNIFKKFSKKLHKIQDTTDSCFIVAK